MRVLTIAGTSIRRFLREKENLFFVFGFPVLIILFIGLQFGSSSVPVLGVVGADGPVGVVVVDEVEAAGFATRAFDDREEAEHWVERGWVTAVVVVGSEDPVLDMVEVEFIARPGIGIALRGPVTAAVSVATRDAVATRALVATGTDPSAARDAVEEAAATLDPTGVDVEVVGDPLFSGSVGQFDLGASSQLVLFTFLTSLSTSGYLILSRRLGVSQRMLSTPTRVSEVVAGETLGRFGIAVVQALFIVGVTAVAFGVDWGDPVGSMALVAVFALVSTGAGILLGTFLANDQVASGIGVMLGIGMGALGGAMVPYELFPEVVQQFARFTPHNWALQGFRVLLFEDGTIVDIGPQLAVLASMAVVVLGAAVVLYRRTLSSG